MASFPPPLIEAKGGWTYADPRVLKGLVRLDPLLRVDRQHLVDEVLGLGRHGVPLGGRVLKNILLFPLDYFDSFPTCQERNSRRRLRP